MPAVIVFYVPIHLEMSLTVIFAVRASQQTDHALLVRYIKILKQGNGKLGALG
jgi:hypothetical protein